MFLRLLSLLAVPNHLLAFRQLLADFRQLLADFSEMEALIKAIKHVYCSVGLVCNVLYL